MPLPELVDYDTLLFAPALAARGRAVRPVVDELLAVANDPDRLQGVDPTLVRVRAADLLSLEHDPALLPDAVEILREAVALALPGELGVATDALARTLAEQGDFAALDALVQPLLRQRPSLSWAPTLMGISAAATIFGYGKQASGWLDEALAGPGGSDRTARRVLADAKERLVKIRATMTADGCDPDDPAAARARWGSLPEAAATVTSHPPWPAGHDGRLVWWPEPEYARLMRQLPELATILGAPWRGHTGRVQTAMADGATAGLHWLVAAEFGQFAGFLEWSRADPLASSTMTAFGALASTLPAPVRWPPKDRALCWCGSGNRYRDCCARQSAAA